MEAERELMGMDAEQFHFFAPAEPPHLVSPLALAYLGDAVYELFIRQYVLSLPSKRPNALHREATRYVSAKAQARIARMLAPLLTEEEENMFRRGRNAKGHAAPKNTEIHDYRQSTGFECLIGYLFLSKRYERLDELMRAALNAGNQADEKTGKGAGTSV